MLNHLPSIGQIVGCIIFIFGFALKKNMLQTTGAYVILFTSIIVIPVSRSGEESEETIEHIGDVSHHDIHEHEDAAGEAFVISLISGFVALVFIMVQKKRPHIASYISIALVIACITSIAFLIRASHLGGIIRHPELRTGNIENKGN
jgi:MFS superfamily sulfate permease-like transporter